MDTLIKSTLNKKVSQINILVSDVEEDYLESNEEEE